MNFWHVAFTHPLKETFAKLNLENQGFEVYLPQFKKLRRHARKTDEILVPLFPRYIFIKFKEESAAWSKVSHTRGVVHLLKMNGQPACVDEKIIHNLQEKESASGVVPISSLLHFVKGDVVCVTWRAFEQVPAVFDSLAGKDRAQILLDFLGREMKLTVPAISIERRY